MNTPQKRIESAQQTLMIIEQGFYHFDDNKIAIQKDVEHAVSSSILYKDDWESVLSNAQKKINTLDYKTAISVENTTTLHASYLMLEYGSRVGCLNFASAKNAGGGFLNGAIAQEESLACASALYPSLVKFQAEMYDYNRKQNTYLYSDRMIYSPQVPFFKSDNGELLRSPLMLDVLTSPAVNVGAMENNRPSELQHVDEVMLARLDKILSLFVLHGNENLVLGAWGCGVFRNDPKKVAGYFRHFLKDGGKYERCFKKVVFAILDRSKMHENIDVFTNIFLT